ncbi:hypothetical protein ACLS0F_10160 [Avibacterium endocarditidis]|uniref:hypothetical protein n=1 Tax=Avibacterium endocarditidis TaxID=380674 RepID=UPI003BF8D149
MNTNDPAEQNMPQPNFKDLRQPMIASIGIVMGFLLNFLAGWAAADDSQPAVNSLSDLLIAASLLVGLVMMLGVLYRLLAHPERMQQASHYQTTFRLYFASLILTFGGLILALFI